MDSLSHSKRQISMKSEVKAVGFMDVEEAPFELEIDLNSLSRKSLEMGLLPLSGLIPGTLGVC